MGRTIRVLIIPTPQPAVAGFETPGAHHGPSVRMEVDHDGDQLGAVPTGPVVPGVPAALRYRSEVLPSHLQGALAAWIPLPEVRWPGRAQFRREGRVYYQCRRCRHQTTLGSGTLLAHNKLPLRTWLLALYLLTTTKTNLAALELMRHLGVNWKTAWRLKHKVLHVMAAREATRRLDGYVQIPPVSG